MPAIFKPSLLLSLIILTGCASPHSRQLYLHYGLDSQDGPQWLLTAPVRVGEPFHASGDDFKQARGRIDHIGDDWRADVTGSTGAGSGFYRGAVSLEHPVGSLGGASSGGATPFWFAFSTNSDYHPVMSRLDEVHDRARGIIR